ncbi:MAG: energy-coupling factor ABC transporter ATP-binding protein [Candidatus Omnitrophica bacterium]|nr:energy-coupling factor ABC transporter ATP-binding protein [Candidatus Omnitrophota bacterium]
MIEIDNLFFHYPDGHQALRDVSLHVSHGDRVGLVGPNGAGKTTLFLVLSGVINQFGGYVSVAGCDLRTSGGRKAVHQKLGIVFQNSDDQLFNASVLEDVAFGPLNLGLEENEIRRRVDDALASAGLGDEFKNRLPFHLSGGEKRRVAIAGVLAMQPQVLLLDEPSSDLDPRGRRELIGILDSLPITRVISSHDLDFVLQTCQRVVVFDEGRIVADGAAREILSDREIMLEHGLDVPLSLQIRKGGSY